MTCSSAGLWDDFVQRCADDILCGKLTTQHMRRALEDPQLRLMGQRHDFRKALAAICEKNAPRAINRNALLLEVNAAAVRFEQLLRQPSRSHETASSLLPAG